MLPPEVAGELHVDFERDCTEDEEDEYFLPRKAKESKKSKGHRKGKKKLCKRAKKNKDVENPDWKKDSSQFIPLTKAGRINVHLKLEHLEGKTPFDIWSLLFTQDMVDMITVETAICAP